MRMNGAEIIIRLLERQGIEYVSGIPGGANLPIYDALGKSRIRHVLARHEQGAAFIAQGMARSTGFPAVCFATSGPGATNLLTAIADAYMDSVPLVAITGQVSRDKIGTDAFQEIDICGMAAPAVKHCVMAGSASHLLELIPLAFEIAASGRPGPVLIDVPVDVQKEYVDVNAWPVPGTRRTSPLGRRRWLHSAAELINSSERPVLYIGGGVIHSNSSDLVRQMAAKGSIPAVATLMAQGVFSKDDPLYLGMPGMHADRYTNLVLDRADLLITVGARFDDRVTGMVSNFCSNARVIHIDIDAAEINKIKDASCPVTADAKEALEMLVPLVEEKERSGWLAEISERRKVPEPCAAPERMIEELSCAFSDDAIVVTDVGQHQMWAARSYPFTYPGQLLTSGGLGTMGFGLPAAIGASLANPDRQVVCFTGDGSVMMNLQELATLSELECDVKVIVLDNAHLGLVRQQQELFYGGNLVACRFEKRADLAGIAAGFGVRSLSVRHGENLDSVMDILLQRGPVLVDLEVDSREMVFPMVPPGGVNTEMVVCSEDDDRRLKVASVS